MIITIDGPVGSGKSTVARLLAKSLGFFHLDTGAIYRSIAYLCIKNNVNRADENAVVEFAKNLNLNFVKDGEDVKVYANGEEVTEEIRRPDVSLGASDVGKLRRVRAVLVDIQRRFAANNDIVAEGRDMGTVIFPDADIKFFLDASIEVRAKRRFLELKSKGIDVSYEKVLQDVHIRDVQDTERDVAPLKPAKDAIIVNTDCMSIDEVLGYLLNQVRRRCRL